MGAYPAVEEDIAPGEYLIAVAFEGDSSSDGVFKGEGAVGRGIEDDLDVSKHGAYLMQEGKTNLSLGKFRSMNCHPSIVSGAF